MKIHRIATAGLLAATLCACGGCSDQFGTTGTMTVSLTDAPFPFDMITAAELGVDGVEVHVTAAEEDASGFYTVSDSVGVVNLLELSNGVTEFLGQMELPTGQVKQMRLLVSSASVELSDGRTFDLNVPSGDASGLKVFFDPPVEIVEGATVEVLIDADVSRSFSSEPASPTKVEEITGFRFHPVLRAVVTDATGSLSGHVTAAPNETPIAAATVSIWENGAAVTSTATNANGEWMMLGLEPGTKIVRAEAAGFESGQVTATVVAGETTAGVELALDGLP
jgi:hypothetical protein